MTETQPETKGPAPLTIPVDQIKPEDGTIAAYATDRILQGSGLDYPEEQFDALIVAAHSPDDLFDA